MTIIPRNKPARGLLIGCAAVSAVMVGPILIDATAQAAPPASCVGGGVCLTPVSGVAGTATETVTVPTTATQTETERVTETATVPVTQTVTQPPVTQTVTGPATQTVTATVTQPVTQTVTKTVTQTVTQPPVTQTVTVPVTQTVTQPPVTQTVTATVTTGTTATVTVTPTRGGGGFPTGTITFFVRPRPMTTTSGSCGTAGYTETLGDGEVETCGPTTGRAAAYATQPGEYDEILNDSSSDASDGIFAPQYLFGTVIGCYYVPNRSTVAPPGATVTTGGTIVDAVAFGPEYAVANPFPVPIGDCGVR
jgi:hypothetical protein